MPTFHELEKKWGEPAAYHFLLETEKVANIPSWKMVGIDSETRLSLAFRINDLALAAYCSRAA